jgi:hypothetical protein
MPPTPLELRVGPVCLCWSTHQKGSDLSPASNAAAAPKTSLARHTHALMPPDRYGMEVGMTKELSGRGVS